jgi:dTDP-4-amino-4,6-dideoxygalactose transaminase
MDALPATPLEPVLGPSRPRIGVGGFQLGARARELVMEVLESNRLTAGPLMARFECEIARLHERRHALMCNSGTSALHIALAALKEVNGWADGDEVLVPAVTFVATANVVLHNGLRPVFVDVEPDHFMLDPDRIEERITDRTRAIMPVHVGGCPCAMDPILDASRRHDLRVVEDSAETMFARYRGRPVGSFGDVGCFSTYAAHVITTGVGGICTTDDDRLLCIMQSLMNHGRDSSYVRIDDDQGIEGEELFDIVERRFSFVRIGHSFRCTELEAAIGIAQLEKWEIDAEHRRANAERLSAGLAPLRERLRLPTPRADAEHAWMFYPLVVTEPSIQRAHLVRHLENRGIETRYLLPLINQPAYRALYGNLDAQYPVAAMLNERAFYVGCHVEMTDADTDYVIESIREFFDRRP